MRSVEPRLSRLVHDAARRDLTRFASTPRVAGRRLALLGAHWEFVGGMLRHHHDGLHAILWPRLPGAATELAAARRAHHAADAAFTRATPGFGTTDRAAFATAVARIRALLDEADRLLLPVLRDHADPALWTRFVAAQRLTLDPADEALLLPWSLETSPPEVVTGMLAILPVQARTAFDESWRPAYERLVTDLWRSEV